MIGTRRVISAILVLLMGVLFFAQKPRPSAGQPVQTTIDLNGVWKYMDGSQVLIEHNTRSNSVTAKFVKPYACPSGYATIERLFDGKLQGTKLSGNWMSCHDKLLVDTCGKEATFQGDFTASAGQSEIGGKFYLPYFTWTGACQGLKISTTVDPYLPLVLTREPCKNKVKLSVSNVKAVGDMWWGNRTIKCQFWTYACNVQELFQSDERENTPGACADYLAKAKALEGREVCCDVTSAPSCLPDKNAFCDANWDAIKAIKKMIEDGELYRNSPAEWEVAVIRDARAAAAALEQLHFCADRAREAEIVDKMKAEIIKIVNAPPLPVSTRGDVDDVTKNLKNIMSDLEHMRFDMCRRP